MHRVLKTAIGALCALLIAGLAHAAYPEKTVRLVVPFGPGSGVDIVGRLLAQKLSEQWPQPVIVENRAGAAGNIAAELVSKSAPDGYTLLLGNIATHGINPALFQRKLPYDAIADFAPVVLIATGSFVLVVHPSLPVKSLAQLIALAKANPAKLNYASSGTGSGSHMAAELFKFSTGLDIVHVPYKGGGEAVTALLSGEVALEFNGALSVLPFVKSGRVRVLAVSSAKRSALLPDVPTMAEAGAPGNEADLWFGVLGRAKTPDAIVSAVNTALNAALSAPDIKSRFRDQDLEIVGGTPDQFAAFIKAEITKWTRIVNATRIRAE